jgi:DNA polymerase-3 subunit delta
MASVSPHELLARLAKGKPISGILLVGSDSYLRDLCRSKLIDAYVAEGTRDWGVRKFSADDDDVSAILAQAQTMPMLAPQQVIFVSEVEAWERLGDDSRDSLVKQISEYLDNPAPFTVLVFEAAALDQRMRLAKLFAEKTVTVSVELSSDPAERVRLAMPLSR